MRTFFNPYEKFGEQRSGNKKSRLYSRCIPLADKAKKEEAPYLPDFFLKSESDRRGSNPRSRPWQGRALPTTPLSHIPTYPAWKAGVLPLNYTRRNRSDPDLTADALCRNAQNRNRTSDTRIFSPLLYQLSYLGLCCLMYALASATKIILTSFCISVNTFFKIMKIFCYYSARSVRSLRRPYENRPAGSIRPGAKRLEWPDAVTARPKALC